MSEWKKIFLGEHCKIRTGKKDVNEGSPSGEYPFFTCSRDISWSDYYSFDTEAVLIAGNGDVGNLHYYNGKFEAYQRTYVLDNFSLNIHYIRQYLKAFLLKALEKEKIGTSIPYIKLEHLSLLPIHLPVESREQQKIATILTSIDTAIEKTEALIEKYQQIKSGLMHDLFTRGVLPSGQLRPTREQAPELYQETKIGWIPREWGVLKMIELAEDRPGSTTIGPFGSDLVASDYRVEGVPIVFVRDVKEDGFKWKSDTYVTHQKALRLKAHNVKAGDVLATKMGLPPCLSCVYPEWMENGVITADIVRLTPNKKKVDATWLSSAINHDRVIRQVATITAGVTRPKVTLADFRNLKIAVPLLDEQLLISKRLAALQSQIDLEVKKVTKFNSQKLGLMQDLLTGKVPVTGSENADQEEAYA